MEPTPDVTLLLNKFAAGDQEAAAELVPPVYEELRRLAAERCKLAESGTVFCCGFASDAPNSGRLRMRKTEN